jgi:SAM-dependent methyltransferase
MTDPATSFGAAARRYHRPPLPGAAVDWLVPAGCERMVELGAGTGLFTLQLVERLPAPEKVIATDPDPRMLRQLKQACPQVACLLARAESLPLLDADADVVFAVGAWHWFDPVATVTEVARVLRPGGWLAVGWRGRPDPELWLPELHHAVQEAHEPGREAGVFTLPEGSPFLPPEHAEFCYLRHMTAADIVNLCGTYAGVLELPQPYRKMLLDRALAHVTAYLDGRESIDVPFRATCYRTRLMD